MLTAIFRNEMYVEHYVPQLPRTLHIKEPYGCHCRPLAPYNNVYFYIIRINRYRPIEQSNSNINI